MCKSSLDPPEGFQLPQSCVNKDIFKSPTITKMPGFFLTELTQKNNIFDLSLLRKRSRRERLDSLSEADAEDDYQNEIYERC